MLLLVSGLIIYVVVLSVVCSAAILLGGPTERRVAWALIVAVVLTQLGTLVGSNWRGPEYGVMVVDVGFTLALIPIARHSKRFWPIWATASQLIGTLTHFASILHPAMQDVVYAIAQPIWAFPLMGALAWGTMTARRDHRSTSWPTLPASARGTTGMKN